MSTAVQATPLIGIRKPADLGITFKRITVDEIEGYDGIVVVDFKDKRLIVVEQLGTNLFSLNGLPRIKKIILDFSSVEYISSAGVVKLHAFTKQANNQMVYVANLNLQQETIRRFASEILGNPKYNVHYTLEEALEAAKEGRLGSSIRLD